MDAVNSERMKPRNATETFVYDMEDPWRPLFECVVFSLTPCNVLTAAAACPSVFGLLYGAAIRQRKLISASVV